MNSKLDRILAPIAEMAPSGEDLTYAIELDEIRSARKGDDPALSQGDWVRELKAPQWGRVEELCSELLTHRGKHLQLAAWYTEARTHLDGFGGLAEGLNLVQDLLQRFWESLYPMSHDSDHEERAARIEWLNDHLPTVVRQIPITSGTGGALGWCHWQESRTVENLGQRDPLLREQALAEGRVSADDFQRAVAGTSFVHLETTERAIQDAGRACEALQVQLDHRFGDQAPVLEDLAKALGDCLVLVEKLLRPHRLTHPCAFDVSPKPHEPEPHALPTIHLDGAIHSRAEAVARLREVAAYFRSREPHSPVSYLVERSARWAEMPLERWLEGVIKDDTTLSQLRELLGIDS